MKKANAVLKTVCMMISFFVALRLVAIGQKELMCMACVLVILFPFIYNKATNIYRLSQSAKKDTVHE